MFIRSFFTRTRTGTRVLLIFVAVVLVFILGFFIIKYFLQHNETAAFFHQYDGIGSRDDKEAKALDGLRIKFPIGSSVEPLLQFFSHSGAFCKTQTWIPPTDRFVMPGNPGKYIYCEESYADPNPANTFGLIRDLWGIGVQIDEDHRTIEKLSIHFERD